MAKEIEYTATILPASFLQSMFDKRDYALYRNGTKVWTLKNRSGKAVELLLVLLNKEVNR